jgi:hypothetical protein
MTEYLDKPVRKRKVLTLKLETPKEALEQVSADPTRFTRREDCFFMVFNEQGHMPKRVYGPDEIHTAYKHASQLARETGYTFHVMRSWRVVKPRDE